MIFYDSFNRNIISPLSIVKKYKMESVKNGKVLFSAFFGISGKPPPRLPEMLFGLDFNRGHTRFLPDLPEMQKGRVNRAFSIPRHKKRYPASWVPFRIIYKKNAFLEAK